MAVLADENRTILFSSHNTLDVEQISDQITFIDRGRIIASADKEIFLDRWRRVRLVLSREAVLPRLPGIVEVGGSGHLPVLVTNNYAASSCSGTGGCTFNITGTASILAIFTGAGGGVVPAEPTFAIDVVSSTTYPTTINHGQVRLWDTPNSMWPFIYRKNKNQFSPCGRRTHP
jgi:hypothetical protein